MSCPATPEPEVKLADNRWMLLALGLLWILAIWLIAKRLWQRDEFARLSWLLTAGVAYLAITAGFLDRYYRPRRYRGFYLHQLLTLAVMVYAARGFGLVAFLVLPAVSQAVMFLPPREMSFVITAQVLVGCSSLFFIPFRSYPEFLFSYGSALLFGGGCAYAIRRELVSRRELHEAHEKLRAYSGKAEALAAAEERARLAREIHDGVAHHLTAANVLVEAGLALLPPTSPAAALDSLQKGQSQIRSALDELRHSISGRQYSLSSDDLPTRIRSLIAEGNFSATLTLAGPPRRLAPEAEQALFRIAQEALTNARKHAPGSAIRLQLDFANATRAILSIENQEPPQTQSGDGAFGLLSLRERMQRLGGTFHAGPNNAGFFVVRAELPA